MIGSFRLPTHRHDAHRNFFGGSLLKLKSKFLSNVLYLGRWAQMGKDRFCLSKYAFP